MHTTLLKDAIFAALLIVSMSTGAATIPDAPVEAIKPGLEANDKLAITMGWLDDHTLLVTAQISSQSDFWARKVMLVDVRTSKTKEMFHQGAVVCTNPTEGIAGIQVGSMERMFFHNSKEPEPTLTLYSWSSQSGVLTPKIPADNWNPSVCKKTKPSDTNFPGGAFEENIRHLEAKNGTLAIISPDNTREKHAVLFKNNKPIATLEVAFNEIAPDPLYLPFSNKYLLSAGDFIIDKTIKRTRIDGTVVTENPILTMTASGEIKREYVRPIFGSYEFTGSGDTRPYAKGTLIYILNSSQGGSGIYLNQSKALKRIWRTNDANNHLRLTSVSMSPDGCYFAFFSKGSDALDRAGLSNYDNTLKILPLCKQ